MLVDRLLKDIEIVSTSINYWFVRTDSGDNYKTFHEHNFIGIGWNYISLDDIQNKTAAETIAKISKREKIDLAISKQRGKATAIYNKVLKFSQLKKGDVVIIPSYKSSRLSFGIIADNAITIDTEKSHDCDYYKRRRVHWKAEKHMGDLDKTFFLIKRSQHSIASVNAYAEYIDSVIYNLYAKEGYSHLILNVRTHQDINWPDLGRTLVEMYELLNVVKDVFELEEDVQHSSIRLNLQSPGMLNFKQAGVSLLLLAMVLGSSSCNNQPEIIKTKVAQVQQLKHEKIDSINERLRSLSVVIP